MINKDIDKITEADLRTLIDNEVLEHKTIEYKQSLPGNPAQERKEFLADVSSFANASGGDLIYGLSEDKETGKPKSLVGIDIQNVDQEKLRLDNMIRTGIQPRLPSVSISPISLSNSRYALIVRVPKSWISPHRVIFEGHDKFYSRSSNGKYPLDVGELRVAFNLSETVAERIRNFRQDRVSTILANETPVAFYDKAKLLLHLIPIISLSPGQRYDIAKITSQAPGLMPIYSHGWNHRYNLDGILAYSIGQDGKSHSYVQVYRNGIIEAVEGLLLEPHEGALMIPSVAYEQELIKSLSQYIAVLKSLEVELPIFVFLTLTGVKSYSMAVSRRFAFHGTHTIDRDVLSLPEVVIERYDVKAEGVFKPCFDSIWNACGFIRSFNYNDKGEWAPQR